MKRKEPFFLAALEYLALRLVFALYGLIPAAKAYDIGAALTRSVYPLFRGRRRLAIDNILKAGITADPAEADRIARRAFGHFAGHLCEALKVGQVVTQENWREHLILEGPEESWRLLFETPDTPIMILCGHHGVWEAAGQILSYKRPIIAVARKMNNPFIDRYLRRHHFRGSVTIIDKKQGFTPDIIREWRRSCAALTLVMDQRANQRQGIPVDFLGRPALTHTSPARLHLASNAPILVGAFIREAAFRYRVVTGTPIRFAATGDRAADTLTLLTEINRRIGDLVRRFPEQYLWAHNRWRM
jgi:KDO2-lipid IV(A) lauroyltransferase